MAARPSFQQRFAQQQAVIEQQAAAQDQGDYGQTGGEEMAPEGAESQLGNREVRHVSQSGSTTIALNCQHQHPAQPLRGFPSVLL